MSEHVEDNPNLGTLAWAWRNNDDEPFTVSVDEPDICWEKYPLVLQTYAEAAIRTYAEARGLALVPKEATEDMLDAAFKCISLPDGMVYAAMISAAPDPFKDSAA